MLDALERTQRMRFADRFRPDDAAPLATLRAARPGPGATVATQSDGALATSGGRLVLMPQTTPAWGDLRLLAAQVDASGIQFARSDRLPLVCEVTDLATGAFRVGYWSTTTLGATLACGFACQPGSGGATRITFLPTTGLTDISATRLAVIPRAAGAAYAAFIPAPAYGSSGVDGRWHLLVITDSGSSATLFAGVSSYDAEAELSRLMVLGSGQALTPALDVASPASGAEYAAIGHNVLADVKLTVGGSLVAGHRQELRLRWLDDDNHLALRLTVNAGATAAELSLVEVVDGAATTKEGPNGGWTAGQSVWVQVWLLEESRKVNYRATAAGTTWTPTTGPGASLDQTERGAGVKPVVTGSGTVTELKVWRTALPYLGAGRWRRE